MVRNTARLAALAVSGATALTVAVAGPALACTAGDGGWSRPAAAAAMLGGSDATSTTPLADAQARVDAAIAHKLAWIDTLRQKVATSDRLDATQQAAVLDRLQKAETALTQLRSDVAAATTLADLRDVLSASDAARWLRWSPRHHRGGFAARHWSSDDKAAGDHHGDHYGDWSGDHHGDWSGDHHGDWSGDRDGDWSGDRDGDWSGDRDGSAGGDDGDWGDHHSSDGGDWGGR